MTLQELENTYPNGFHDSELVSVSVDFPARTCCIELDVDCGDPDPNVYTRTRVKLSGLSLFIFEPLDAQSGMFSGTSLWVDGHETTLKLLPDLEQYRTSAPANSFFYSFFLREWNCFLHLGATDARLTPASAE
jgi:hypothetical protein